MKNILLVEDNPDQMQHYAGFIWRYSNGFYKIIPSLTATRAIDLARVNDFAGIVTDLCLPDMSGYQLFTTLRKQYDNYTPVLIHSDSECFDSEYLADWIDKLGN